MGVSTARIEAVGRATGGHKSNSMALLFHYDFPIGIRQVHHISVRTR